MLSHRFRKLNKPPVRRNTKKTIQTHCFKTAKNPDRETILKTAKLQKRHIIFNRAAIRLKGMSSAEAMEEKKQNKLDTFKEIVLGC